MYILTTPIKWTLNSAKRCSASFLMQRAATHARTMQFERAWDDVGRALLSGDSLKERTPTADEIFIELLGICLTLTLSKDARDAILILAVSKGVQDGYLSEGVVGLYGDAFPVADANAFFPSELNDPRLPFCGIVIRILCLDLASARDQLVELKPGTVIEEALYLKFALMIAILNPKTSEQEDTASFARWSNTGLKYFSDFDLENISNLDTAILAAVLFMVCKVAKQMQSPHQQYWDNIYNKIEARSRLQRP